ncbi:MAG: hypothetical protein WAN20_21690 [Pseudonocardiaceae bacterium]
MVNEVIEVCGPQLGSGGNIADKKFMEVSCANAGSCIDRHVDDYINNARIAA